RRERQVRSIAVEQVERGDIGMERVPRAVDGGLKEFVPGARGRGEAGDLMEEAQLRQLVRGGQRLRPGRRRSASAGRWARRGGRLPSGGHVHHLTRVGKVAAEKGCGAVLPRLRKRWGGGPP